MFYGGMLYKVDSKGKLRYWYAQAQGDKVSTFSGIVGSEETSQVSEVYTAKPTNVGKKSERNAEEQAVFEAKALYRNKREKRRYHDTQDAALNYVSEDVQLVQDFTKGKNAKKIKWGEADAQYKLDGVRCRITFDRKGGVLRVWSRQNKPYVLPFTLYREILALFRRHPNLNKLDGELYIHGMDFSDIVSRVKDVNHPERDELQFWLYDTIEPNLDWTERKALIGEVDQSLYTRIIKVDSFLVKSLAEAEVILDKAIELGFEGLIIRNWKGKYQCGERSYDVQKWKRFMDAEFIMVRVEPDKRGHGVGVFVTDSGAEFNARWKSSDEKRKALAENPEPYIGKPWTLRFQKYSLDGIPIFVVAIAPRDYE